MGNLSLSRLRRAAFIVLTATVVVVTAALVVAVALPDSPQEVTERFLRARYARHTERLYELASAADRAERTLEEFLEVNPPFPEAFQPGVDALAGGDTLLGGRGGRDRRSGAGDDPRRAAQLRRRRPERPAARHGGRPRVRRGGVAAGRGAQHPCRRTRRPPADRGGVRDGGPDPRGRTVAGDHGLGRRSAGDAGPPWWTTVCRWSSRSSPNRSCACGPARPRAPRSRCATPRTSPCA